MGYLMIGLEAAGIYQLASRGSHAARVCPQRGYAGLPSTARHPLDQVELSLRLRTQSWDVTLYPTLSEQSLIGMISTPYYSPYEGLAKVSCTHVVHTWALKLLFWEPL